MLIHYKHGERPRNRLIMSIEQLQAAPKMYFLHANLLLSVLVLHGLMVQSDAEAVPTVSRAGRRALPAFIKDLPGVSSPTTTSVDPTATSLIPSASSTATSLSINLTHGVEDAWFPSIPSGGDDTNGIPLKLGCKNCSTSGTLTLTQGEWSFLDSDLWFEVENLTDIIDVGYIELSIQGFVAHLELQIEPDVKGELAVPLFVIPVAAFVVSGYGHRYWKADC